MPTDPGAWDERGLLLGKGGGGVRFPASGLQSPEFTHEARIGQKFHRLQHGAQTFVGDHMNHRAAVAGDCHEGAALRGMDGSSSLALEVPHGICALHVKKMVLWIRHCKSERSGKRWPPRAIPPRRSPP